MRAERRDANEAEIITALREAGCEVWQLCAREPADLLVLCAPTHDGEEVLLLEVKDSAKPPSARKLTPKQQETHKTWPVLVVSTVAEALQAVRGGV
jgi:Holliday junction resolvase